MRKNCDWKCKLYQVIQRHFLSKFLPKRQSYGYQEIVNLVYYSTRSISSVGVVAKGDYSGQTYIARTEGGYVFDLGRKFTITPFNVLTYAVNRNSDYTESDAGTLSLNVSSNQTNFFEERVGLRLMHNGLASGNSRINSRIQASYGYNFYTTKQTADNNFVGQTASFQSSAANIYQGSLKLYQINYLLIALTKYF